MVVLSYARLDREDMPVAGNALQRVRPAIPKLQPRPRHEIHTIGIGGVSPTIWYAI
jgi:hypothetical protein